MTRIFNMQRVSQSTARPSAGTRQQRLLLMDMVHWPHLAVSDTTVISRFWLSICLLTKLCVIAPQTNLLDKTSSLEERGQVRQASIASILTFGYLGSDG